MQIGQTQKIRKGLAQTATGPYQVPKKKIYKVPPKKKIYKVPPKKTTYKVPPKKTIYKVPPKKGPMQIPGAKVPKVPGAKIKPGTKKVKPSWGKKPGAKAPGAKAPKVPGAKIKPGFGKPGAPGTKKVKPGWGKKPGAKGPGAGPGVGPGAGPGGRRPGWRGGQGWARPRRWGGTAGWRRRLRRLGRELADWRWRRPGWGGIWVNPWRAEWARRRIPLRWRSGLWLGTPVENLIFAWRVRRLEDYLAYHKALNAYLRDRMGYAFWEVINKTGDNITVVTEDPNDPGLTLPFNQEYGSEIWHSNSFNIRVITEGDQEGGQSKVFYNIKDHFIEVYVDTNGELQIETWNE